MKRVFWIIVFMVLVFVFVIDFFVWVGGGVVVYCDLNFRGFFKYWVWFDLGYKIVNFFLNEEI